MVDISVLDRLYEKATPGPWEIEGVFTETLPEGQADGNVPKLWSTSLYESIGPDPRDIARAEVSCFDPSLRWRDAELVVALVNAYPALRDRIRELEAELSVRDASDAAECERLKEFRRRLSDIMTKARASWSASEPAP